MILLYLRVYHHEGSEGELESTWYRYKSTLILHS